MTEPRKTLGHYELVSQLAVGGMAEIYVAKAAGVSGFEKRCALKVIHPNYSSDPEFVQMLVDEAKLAVQLQHANIVQTFDLGRVGEQYYIAMELIDGVDLYKVLRRASDHDIPFPFEVATFIAQETCSGLDYAHRKTDPGGRPLEIVHRDISPQNVLVTYDGQVKIVDFGIAKAAMRSQRTAAGVIKGKYYYMSPEQAWGEKVDARTDVFSTGIVLYEMLVGQMLYLEDDLERLLSMVRRAEIKPPSTLRPDVPAELDRIVMKALARRPDDRYARASDFSAALSRFLHTQYPSFTRADVGEFVTRVQGEQPVRKVDPRHQAPTMAGRDDFADDEHSLISPLPPPIPSSARLIDQGTTPAGPRAHKSGRTAPPLYPSDEATVVDQRLAPPSIAESGFASDAAGEETEVAATSSDFSVEDSTTRRKATGEFATLPVQRAHPLEAASQASANDASTLVSQTTPPRDATATVATPARGRPPGAGPLSVSEMSSPWTGLPPSSGPKTPPAPDAGLTEPFEFESPLAPQHESAGGTITEAPPRRRWRGWLWAGLLVTAALGAAATVVLIGGSSTRGVIEIVSTPPGAQVRIDGALVHQPTPLKLADIDPSQAHHVSVSVPGFDPWESDVRFEGSTRLVRLQAVLVPVLGTLHIESTPPGAEVIANGRIQGSTPTDVTDLSTREDAVVELRLRGYRVVRQAVAWNGKRNISLSIPLIPAGRGADPASGSAPSPDSAQKDSSQSRKRSRGR